MIFFFKPGVCLNKLKISCTLCGFSYKTNYSFNLIFFWIASKERSRDEDND